MSLAKIGMQQANIETINYLDKHFANFVEWSLKQKKTWL
jgi:hypothetical protein